MSGSPMRHNLFAAILIAIPADAAAQPATPSPVGPGMETPPSDPTPAPVDPVTPIVPATPVVPVSPVPMVTSAGATTPALAAPTAPPTGSTITVGGYLEAYYQAHFQNPANRITNLRGFDNRSRTFTLSNVALDIKGETGPLTARVILQVGSTPSTYYLAEPALAGSGSVNGTSSELWKYVQQATVTANAPGELTIEVGLFPSPIGPEVFAIKDNWNWSRSNLFFGLPFYHTGARVSRPLGGGWTGTLAVYNGWNSVVDNNAYPSAALSAGYASPKTTAQVLYFGGVERPTSAPEGKAWRHLFDVLVQHAITDTVSVMAQIDAGIEPNDIGTSSWIAGALYGKFALSPQVYAAVRGDYFYEQIADDGGTTAASIFWPTKWVASGTLTLAYQPVDKVSVRLEYRHDQADSDVFFGGAVAGDGDADAFVFDRDMQDTATLGVTAWF